MESTSKGSQRRVPLRALGEGAVWGGRVSFL